MQRIISWLLTAIFALVPMQAVQANSLQMYTGEQAQAGESAQTFTTQNKNGPAASVIAPSNQVTTTQRTQPTPTATNITATTSISSTLRNLTSTTTLSNSQGLTLPSTVLTPTNPPPAVSPVPTDKPIEGTIIANRTQATVRFFVEGKTYELGTLRSQGLTLPRETVVLNLYNCDAKTPETQAGCYWDPYLLNRDGFYEVVTGADAQKAVNLTLKEAGAPPVDQIWVQNRTGSAEVLFYNSQQYELPQSAVGEFKGQAKIPLTLYLRSCLAVADRTVCEWYPQSVDPGVYYALTAITTAGTVPNSQINLLQLQPIVNAQAAGPASPTATTTSPQTKPPTQMVCNLQVPAINVRSGPGLEYQIVAKVRGTEDQPGTVLIIGRDVTGQWLAVDERVAQGGWVTGNTDFVKCSGDITALPETKVTDGRLVATPSPGSSAVISDQNTANVPNTPPDISTTAPESAATSVAPPPSIPDGQALVIINNGFDQVMRFTLDQRYRVEQGPSEYDLQPGQSLSFLVFPGQIAFTASTPWRGLSDNADFLIDNRQTRTLYLIFVPDPDGSGRWLLQF